MVPYHLLSDSENDEDVCFLDTMYEPLSNWSAHRVHIWGKDFATVEHAFQYYKFVQADPAWAQAIKRSRSPWEAKRLSRMRGIESRAWDLQRVRVMEELLAAKVRQHLDVRQRLADTGTRAIIDCATDDTFWGYGYDGSGANVLGKVWIKLRSQQASSLARR